MSTAKRRRVLVVGGSITEVRSLHSQPPKGKIMGFIRADGKELSWSAGPLNLHPDNQPWTKCCRNPLEDSDEGVQCFTRKPRNAPSRMNRLYRPEKIHHLIQEGNRFICVHQTTSEGCHRECAGWAALRGKQP